MKELLDYTDDYTLENDRVRLSTLKIDHVPELIKAGQDDAVWTYFIDKGNADMRAYCQSAMDNRTSHLEYPFVIFDKSLRRVAGMTRLYDYNPALRNIKIGHTWIGKPHWGTGLNKNCKYLLFQYAFESLEVQRIGFGVHGQNQRSMEAMKSVGCQKEGVLRSFLDHTEENLRVDLILYSILRTEWQSKIKDMLAQQLYNQKAQN